MATRGARVGRWQRGRAEGPDEPDGRGGAGAARRRLRRAGQRQRHREAQRLAHVALGYPRRRHSEPILIAHLLG